MPLPSDIPLQTIDGKPRRSALSRQGAAHRQRREPVRLHAAICGARGAVSAVSRPRLRGARVSLATSSAIRSRATRREIRKFCSLQLRRDVSDVRQDRRQRPTTPIRCIKSLKKEAPRPARHAGDQMELHQVPGRPQGEVVRRYAPTDKPENLGLDIEAVLDSMRCPAHRGRRRHQRNSGEMKIARATSWPTPKSRRAQRLATADIGRHVADAHQDVEDREEVDDPARAADHCATITAAANHGKVSKPLSGRRRRAPTAPADPDTEARLFRIEALDEAERDIGQIAAIRMHQMAMVMESLPRRADARGDSELGRKTGCQHRSSVGV